MYYDFFQQYKERFKIGGIVLLIPVAWWGIATFIDRYDKIPVVVSVVPSDSKVMFDDKAEGNGTHYMPAGTYKVTTSKDGFDTQTETVVVTNKKEQNVVAVSLTAKSGDAKKWAKEHEADYAKNQTYGAIEAESNGKYFASKNPITTKLPYNDPYFTIGYTTNNDQSITLTIVTPSPRYRFYAVQKIRDLGYDPTNFKVIFKDFHNPLEQK